MEENVANALDGVYNRIHRYVVQGKLPRYFDETTWRDSGQRHHVWIATNKSAAYYKIDPSRSQEAFFKMIGKNTNAPSVTDRYGAYNALDGPHQYCLAHLIREFHAFAEQQGDTGQIGSKIEEELRKACAIQAAWRSGEISIRQRAMRHAHSKRRLDELFTEAIGFGNEEIAGLCMRLGEVYEKLWAFTSVEGMEPTNNMAERDLRKIVLWRKKSYGSRSPRGQRFVERISSVVETIKKNGRNVLSFLEEAVMAFYRKQPAPYIFAEEGV
jgi:transposase